MCLIDQITVIVLTYNEEANIGRALASVSWASRIVVIDSGSTDRTTGIVREHERAEIVTRHFDTFANQCNFGLSNVESEWVLSLDADYVLSPELIDEIKNLKPYPAISGYRANFIYKVGGQSLRATLYPPRVILYRKSKAMYYDEGHGHRVRIEGEVSQLNGIVFHDDRKELSRWFQSQQRYARVEADYLYNCPPQSLKLADRIRLAAWPAPILVFVYTLVWKGCILDGWPGWLYVFQRTVAELMISIELIDRKLSN